MATSRLCSIPNCGNTRARPGEALRFFQETALSHDGDDCLVWPFSLSNYGYASLAGRSVSRLVCEAVNGPPPTPRHQAAHSCGNRPCVNKNHLSWKTSKENHDDRLTHGTHSRREQNGRAKLTETDVTEIRSLKGALSQCKLAVQYGVSQSSISLIQSGKNWPLLTLAATALAVIFFTPPAFAAKQHAEPPARYANAFKGKLIVHTVPQGVASKLCRTLEQSEGGFAGSYIGMMGCSFGGIGTDTPGECVIVVTEGKPHVKRHEIAHCGGWPANHPQ